MAEVFDAYWERMKADVFPPPASESAAGRVVQTQGVPFRREEPQAQPAEWCTAALDGMTVWFSPNDPDRNKKDISVTAGRPRGRLRPDQGGTQAVLFLVFNPSRLRRKLDRRPGRGGGKADPKLIVQGAISDQPAMPNYVAPTKDPVTHKSNKDGKSPFVFPEEGMGGAERLDRQGGEPDRGARSRATSRRRC